LYTLGVKSILLHMPPPPDDSVAVRGQRCGDKKFSKFSGLHKSATSWQNKYYASAPTTGGIAAPNSAIIPWREGISRCSKLRLLQLHACPSVTCQVEEVASSKMCIVYPHDLN
jgi:hypothetical protein